MPSMNKTTTAVATEAKPATKLADLRKIVSHIHSAGIAKISRITYRITLTTTADRKKNRRRLDEAHAALKAADIGAFFTHADTFIL